MWSKWFVDHAKLDAVAGAKKGVHANHGQNSCLCRAFMTSSKGQTLKVAAACSPYKLWSYLQASAWSRIHQAFGPGLQAVRLQAGLSGLMNKIFIAGGGCLTGESEPSRAAARFWFIRSDSPPTGYEWLSFNPYLVRLFVVQLKRRSINPYAEKGLNKRVWNTIQTLSRVHFLLATPWQRAWWVERICDHAESFRYDCTTLAKKIGTAAHQRAQARDLSSMHAPVVWRVWLSQFFWPG